MSKCQYFVGGKWISETEFKSILANGLLDKLVNDGVIKLNNYQSKPTKTKITGVQKVSDKVPLTKIRDILIDEITSRSGYPKNMISALELTEDGKSFKIPLWASPFSDKFESLLTSIIKQKFSGRSYVLGSEEGFKLKEGDDALTDLKDSHIVFSENFDPEKGLLPFGLKKDGTIQPAQIMVPFHFQSKKGNIKLTDFVKHVDGKMYIDMDKIPSKVLKLFGFRIPTQGHNSMMTCEIVGFLPEVMGDLVLAPKDFTVQMGSDFDIDKLYSYMYNVQVVDGKLTTDFEEDSDEFLQNQILDIHHSILSNPNESVIKAIMTPDSFGDFDTLSDKVFELRKKAGLIPTYFSPLSDIYNRDKYINATAGKTGVGTFSLDSTFNALVQGKNIKFPSKSDNNDDESFSMSFGRLVTDGDLSNPYTLKSQQLIQSKGGYDKLNAAEKKTIKYKSDVIRGLQSASVDNANEQILDKININEFTFDTIRAMAQLGFEEKEIIGLITQQVVWEYCAFAKNRRSSTNLNYQQGTTIDLFTDKFKSDYKISDDYNKSNNIDKASADELFKLLEINQLIPNQTNLSNNNQMILFDKFLKLAEIGKTIKTAQSTINADSAGLPKSFAGLRNKVDQIESISKINLQNVDKLLDNTISGHASNVVLFANIIYRNIFPYNKEGFQSIIEEYLLHTDQENITSSKKIEVVEKLLNELKAFIYSNNHNGLVNSLEGFDAVLKKQKRLFTSGKNHNSLADILISIKREKPDFFNRNQFLNKLELRGSKNGQLCQINYEAATGDNLDERSVYTDFIRLFTDNIDLGNGYTSLQLGEDLVAFAYLSGATQQAKQFLKYVPVEYIKGLPLINFLNNFTWSFTSDFGGSLFSDDRVNHEVPSTFIIQYFQNNPKEATTVDKQHVSLLKFITHKKAIHLKPEFFKKYVKEVIVDGKPVYYYPQFINVNNLLYMHHGKGVYENISILSDKYGFKQYSSSMKGPIPSVMNKNNSSGNITINSNESATPLSPTAPVELNKVEPVKQFDPGVINNPLLNDHKFTTKEQLGKFFNTMDNKYYFKLAKILMKLPFDFKITWSNTMSADGQYTDNEIILNERLLKNKDKLATTVLHEMIHAHTSNAIRLWNDSNTRNKLTKDQINIIGKLDGLRRKYLNYLKNSDLENLESFLSKWETYSKQNNPGNLSYISELRNDLKLSLSENNGTFKNEEISKFYGAVKLTEFVTMAMTDKAFQKHLNEITIDDISLLSNMLDKLTELFTLILDSFGIDIKKDSLLAESIGEVLNLLNTRVEVKKAP